MDRLPHEVRKMIIYWLTKEDSWASRQGLKNLRLFDRHWNTIATPALYDTVGVWFGVNSLRRLMNIAYHPEL